MNNFYKAFPWIGIYLKSTRTTSLYKSYEKVLMGSLLLLVIALYYIYIGMARMTDKILFPKTYPQEINENFFGLVATIELIGLFFFRSRLTLLLLPKAMLISSLIFFAYVNFTPYGFYHDAFNALNFCIFGFIFYGISHFEIAALELPANDFRRPNNGRPRTLYQPFFSLTYRIFIIFLDGIMIYLHFGQFSFLFMIEIISLMMK